MTGKVAVTSATGDLVYGFHPMVTLSFPEEKAGGRLATSQEVATLLREIAVWDGHQFILKK